MAHTSRHYALIALQIIVALILFALFLSLYKYTEGLLINECEGKATRDMERIQLTIQREMMKAESAAHAFSSLVFQDGQNLPKDSSQLYRRIEQFLSSMPSTITGAIIGFEDGVYPQYEEQWGFIPLIRHVDGQFVRYQMGAERDVRVLHDWYRETRREQKERWAEPQLAEEGEAICGYCIPLRDVNNSFIGVLEVDFSMERMAEEVCSIKPYPNAEPLVVNNDDSLTVLMSSDPQNVLNHNMHSLLRQRGLSFERSVFESVRSGQSRYHLLRQGDFRDRHEVYFFHMPEPHTGWIIQMTCPTSDVTSALEALKVRMGFIALTIILLIALVALTYLRYS